MRQHFILVLITFIVLLDISKSTSIQTEYLLFIMAVIFFGYSFISRKRINKKILIGAVLWVIINLLVSFFFEKEFPIQKVIRLIGNYIFLPYFLLRYYGNHFLIKLEKLIYILTIISIPLIILNYLIPDTFNNLRSVFQPLTNENLLTNTNYWSSGIYVNAIPQVFNGGILLRNCGFMWEPGYFALIIIWAIVFNWLVNGVRYNVKFIFYVIALISTFSTAGYLAFVVILFASIQKRTIIINIASSILLGLVFSSYIYNLDFVGGKIDRYVEATETDSYNYSTNYNAIKLNRFQIALYDINRVIRYPFGYGHHDRIGIDGIDVVGTNGLSGLLRMWGIPMFVFIILALYRYTKIINYANNNQRTVIFLFIALLTVFFSQSIQYNILTYILIISSFTIKSKSKLVRSKF